MHVVVLQSAPVDPNDWRGRKVIVVPRKAESVEKSRKAIVFLWKAQHATTAPYPNMSPNPRKDLAVDLLYKAYEASLDYDEAKSGTR